MAVVKVVRDRGGSRVERVGTWGEQHRGAVVSVLGP